MRIVLSALFMMLASPAGAQHVALGRQMTAEELEQEMFGVHLFGTVGAGQIWNECIEPDGDTLYTFGESQSRGKAWIPDDESICFNYGGPDHCFQAYRSRDGYIFHGGETVWETTNIRRDVEVCTLSDMIG